MGRREGSTNKLSASEKRRKGRLGSRGAKEREEITLPPAAPMRWKAGPVCAGRSLCSAPSAVSPLCSLSAQKYVPESLRKARSIERVILSPFILLLLKWFSNPFSTAALPTWVAEASRVRLEFFSEGSMYQYIAVLVDFFLEHSTFTDWPSFITMSGDCSRANTGKEKKEQ